jgi:hypothetical protein
LQAIHGNSAPVQILPVCRGGGHDWQRRIGGLCKQHFGTSAGLRQLHVEQDEDAQKRVMEYLVLADWAAQGQSPCS